MINSDKAWISFGKNNAYYGVITDDKYLDQNLTEEAYDQFFTSGYKYVEDVFTLINKYYGLDEAPTRVLDFGCGTGRLAIPFAKKAVEVIGLDVSTQMLKEAEKNAKKYQMENVRFLQSDDRLSAVKDQKFDLINSYIVLQHINTKRGEKIVENLISMLKQGGIGVLHLTYYGEKTMAQRVLRFFRYRIPLLHNIVNVLQGKSFNFPLMQMNYYNMNRIMYMLQKCGVVDTHVVFTNHGGYLGTTLLFKK